ncbi:MAG: ATP-binding protein [Halothiobacillaceae bacterium]
MNDAPKRGAPGQSPHLVDTSRCTHLLYECPIENSSSALSLRARLLGVAQRLGFPESRREAMALVVMEMASNQLKYAQGRGTVQIWEQPGPFLDIFALDYGPGIHDLALASEDGYSSSETLGKGLGSIRRLSDELQVYTRTQQPDTPRKWTGTALLARFWPTARRPQPWPRGIGVGLYSRSLADDRHNGDIIYLRTSDEGLRWLHLDGLGHGREARDTTARLDYNVLMRRSVRELIEATDRYLVGSRGAVGIAADARPALGEYRLSGIGDMYAQVYDARPQETQWLFFPSGVLGKEHKQAVEIQGRLARDNLLITASDGIRRNWDEQSLPGLFRLDPQLIAYVIGSIMGRMSDDQSLCVVRAEGAG